MTSQERIQIGHKVVGTVTEVAGTCSWGHKAGDRFELSGHDTAGLCGFMYHDIFPNVVILQTGGSWPWGEPDTMTVECPDKYNCVKMELKRIRD